MPPYFHRLSQVKWPSRKNTVDYSPLSWGSRVRADDASSDQGSDEGLLEKQVHGATKPRSSRQWSNCQFASALCSLTVVYTFMLFVAIARSTGAELSRLPFSPARDSVVFSEVTLTLEDHVQENSPFTGKPREELDHAWSDLLKDQNIWLEPKYIQHFGREDTAVGVPGANRYIGTMNVFHELHCLKRIHQYMYSDFYFANITDHQRELNRIHNEHCIDFLRLSAMCHGDIGLITYSWHDDQLFPIANATSHQCVNWDMLSQFAHERSIDMLQPGWLRHPTKGPVYPDGEGDIIGAAETEHTGHIFR
ncbi:hypothetical protein F4780DRAFT_782839 [Xylariomycetidae sp. FL0641]|nr:hypothetical protein F4780DRAFT_782839 [Xylariomycetidae sp. FL0641]